VLQLVLYRMMILIKTSYLLNVAHTRTSYSLYRVRFLLQLVFVWKDDFN
jgi:hypothetical protein